MSDDLSALPELLTTRVLGRAHRHQAVVSSTNDVAAQWARQGAPHGAVVTADEQRSGRGRRGRAWVSSREGLAVSVVVRPARADERFGALSLAVAVGLARGLDVAGLALKWPNDLLVGGRKLAGILCESRWIGATPEAIVGFGLNVHQQRFDPPLDTIATSLAQHGAARGRALVLAELLGGLETALDEAFAGGFAALRDEYVARCPWLGSWIGVDDPDVPGRRVRVLAERIDETGALWVRDGKRSRPMTVGEVTLP